MAAAAVTRTDVSVAELRSVAKHLSDNKQARRVLATAMVMDGFNREDAAQACGMDRKMLLDWFHRYDEAGLEGLTDRLRRGRPASLTNFQASSVSSIKRD